MHRRLVFLVAMTIVAFVVLVPAAFSQIPIENHIMLPALSNGETDQEPTQQPPATETSTPTAPSATSPAPTATACVTEQPPATYRLDDLAISLERTACFGVCPEYIVTIYGDGRVVYEGRRNVRVIGREEDTINREQVVALLQRFYDAWFFDLRTEYRTNRILSVDPDGVVELRDATVSDLPSQIVTFRTQGFEKQLVDYFSPPPGLRELEAAIDETAGTEKWVAPPP